MRALQVVYSFNGDLSKWDVSCVQTMNCMFNGATSFNGDVSKCDVLKLTHTTGWLRCLVVWLFDRLVGCLVSLLLACLSASMLGWLVVCLLCCLLGWSLACLVTWFLLVCLFVWCMLSCAWNCPLKVIASTVHVDRSGSGTYQIWSTWLAISGACVKHYQHERYVRRCSFVQQRPVGVGRVKHD